MAEVQVCTWVKKIQPETEMFCSSFHFRNFIISTVLLKKSEFHWLQFDKRY